MLDTIIIGSGPAGLTAAIYAQRAQLRAVVVEKEYGGTGQIAQSDCVDNYPGLPGENGYDLGEKFRSHAQALGASFLEAEVTGLRRDADGWTVLLARSDPLCGKTVVYAAGASHRTLGIPGEAELTGSGVSYCAVCDGAFYADRTVAVVGGGDTALSEALFLSRIAKTVYLVHRRDQFRGNASLQAQVRETANIKPVLEAQPVEVLGDGMVTGLAVRQDGIVKTLPADGIFVAAGLTPNTALLNGIAALDGKGYVLAGEDGRTSAAGLFAAGDVRAKPLRQVVTAASDGACCIASVQRYLESRQ